MKKQLVLREDPGRPPGGGYPISRLLCVRGSFSSPSLPTYTCGRELMTACTSARAVWNWWYFVVLTILSQTPPWGESSR